MGQIILEVNGQSVEAMNGPQVARFIARAYYQTPDTGFIEFVVYEPHNNEIDQQRASLVFLNNNYS